MLNCNDSSEVIPSNDVGGTEGSNWGRDAGQVQSNMACKAHVPAVCHSLLLQAVTMKDIMSSSYPILIMRSSSTLGLFRPRALGC